MKDQDLDKMFSDSLKDQEATPPASVWQGIESKLDETKVIPMKPKLNWQVWAIGACLLIALGIGLNMPDRILNNETVRPQLASKEVNQVEKLPNEDSRLRWVYGKKREALYVEKRNEKKYEIRLF